MHTIPPSLAILLTLVFTLPIWGGLVLLWSFIAYWRAIGWRWWVGVSLLLVVTTVAIDGWVQGLWS